MKIKNSDACQNSKKVTKTNKRTKRSRAARTRSNKKRRRRRFKAALIYNKNKFSKNRTKTSSDPKNLAWDPVILPAPQRPSEMSGNWYWLNYNNVFRWKNHHLSNYSISPYSLPWQDQWQSEELSQETPEKPVDKVMGRETASSEVDFNDDAESDSDFVVTEEMMEFLEINMRHQAALKNEKKNAAIKGEDQTNVEDDRNATEDCQMPSDEADNEKRHSEMTALYGEKAAVIHGMETSLQLTFNRNVDVNDPPYWPIHPFTIRFE